MGPCDTRCRSKSQFEEVRPTLTDKEVGAAGAQTSAPLSCLNIRPISTWSWLVGDHRVWHLRHPELCVDFSCWKHQQSKTGEATSDFFTLNPRVKTNHHLCGSLTHQASILLIRLDQGWDPPLLTHTCTCMLARSCACIQRCKMTMQQNVLTQNEILLHIIIYRITAGLLKRNSTYKKPPQNHKKKNKKKHLHAGYPINNSNNAPIIIIF